MDPGRRRMIQEDARRQERRPHPLYYCLVSLVLLPQLGENALLRVKSQNPKEDKPPH